MPTSSGSIRVLDTQGCYGKCHHSKIFPKLKKRSLKKEYKSKRNPILSKVFIKTSKKDIPKRLPLKTVALSSGIKLNPPK